MKKRGIFPVIILLVLTAGVTAAARAGAPAPPPGRAQEQGERLKVYVRSVVFEENVKNSGKVLGEPDGRFAEIAPGGQMTLLMERPIVPSSGFDDGFVVIKEESQYGLEGWFLVSGTPEDPQFAWMLLTPGASPRGFRLTYHYMERTPEGSPGVKMIRIRNNGTKPLLLDAVVGYGRKETGGRKPALVGRLPL
jgi:hypothetical protein